MRPRIETQETMQPTRFAEQQRPLLNEEGVFYPRSQIFKDTTQIAGANIDFRIQTPDALTDPHAVIIVNGFVGKGFAYSSIRKEIAEQGRVAVSVNPPRRQGWLSSYHHSCITDPMRLLSQGIYAVARKLQNEYGDLTDASQVDLVVHSMGLPVGIRLARKHPGLVRNIVNIEGAGIEERPNPLKFVPRIDKFRREELVPFARGILSGVYDLDQDMMQAAKSEAHYVLAHPLRTASEALYVSSHDIRRPLDQLKRQQDIGVTAILGAQDMLVPAKISLRDGVGLFTRTDVLELGHLGPLTHAQQIAETAADHLAQAN